MKVNCDDKGIAEASDTIRDGGVVIFPTDTVYGIGCDPYDEKAVEKIYKIKSRDSSKPLPVLVHSMEVASKIAEFDKHSEKLARNFWPGPLTLILKLTDKRLVKSLNIDKKIALRVPNNRCVLRL